MRSLIFNLALAAAPLMFSSIGHAESKPAPQLAPPNAPKSEFTFRAGYAKDPFFPRSTDNIIAPPVNLNPGTTPVPSAVPDWISLKGISIISNRKLAIINNKTVGEGEEFSVARSGKTYAVRCVEIKDKSIVISVDGVTKELSLRVY